MTNKDVGHIGLFLDIFMVQNLKFTANVVLDTYLFHTFTLFDIQIFTFY